MKVQSSNLFLFLVLFICIRRNCNGKIAPNSKLPRKEPIVSNIINGLPAVDRPFYVEIHDSVTNDLICGGTIIQQYFIITAARCISS